MHLLKGDGDTVFTWVKVPMEVLIVHNQWLSFFLKFNEVLCVGVFWPFLFNVVLEKLLFDWVTAERAYC